MRSERRIAPPETLARIVVALSVGPTEKSPSTPARFHRRPVNRSPYLPLTLPLPFNSQPAAKRTTSGFRKKGRLSFLSLRVNMWTTQTSERGMKYAKLRYSAVAMLATLAATNADAECGPIACTGYVDQIFVEANGDLYVRTSGNEALANCVPNSGVFLFLPSGSTKFKEIYALLLTAQAQDRQVTLRIIDS